jgi:hypothetical protein
MRCGQCGTQNDEGRRFDLALRATVWLDRLDELLAPMTTVPPGSATGGAMPSPAPIPSSATASSCCCR